MWNDLGNFAGRFYNTAQHFLRSTGMFGVQVDLSNTEYRETLGSIMALQMPQLGKEYIGEAGYMCSIWVKILVVLLVLSVKVNGLLDEENHGLSDYGDNSVDKQAWQMSVMYFQWALLLDVEWTL